MMDFVEYKRRNPEFVDLARLSEAKGMEALAKFEALRNPTTRRAKKLQRHQAWLVANNRDLLFHFAFEGVRAAGQLGAYPPDRLADMAANLKLSSELHEHVHSEQREVRPGKTRLIFNFGPRARARHMMVLAMLKAIHDPHPLDFGHKGKGGVPAAFDAVVTAIREGFCWGLEVDVIDFFPRIRPECLFALLSPLPKAVIRNTVIGAGSLLRERRSYSLGADEDGTPSTGSPWGLPLGAACSNVAASVVMKNALSDLPDGTCAISIADNVMMLGLNEQIVRQAIQAFEGKLQHYVVGEPVLKGGDNPVLDLRTDEFRFVRHVGACNMVGPVGPRVPQISFRPQQSTLDEIEWEIERPDSTKETLRKAIMRVEGWANAYQRWLDREEWTAFHLAQLRSKLLCIVTKVEMGPLAEKIAGHWWVIGHDVDLDHLLPCASWPPTAQTQTRAEVKEAIYRRRDILERRREWLATRHIVPSERATLARRGLAT